MGETLQSRLFLLLSYAFSKHIDEKVAPTPFAPEGYDRGRSTFDRTHILAVNGIYEFPFGKGRQHLNNAHPVVNAILGGWQFAGIYNFVSGQPLSFTVPGATLGNGWNTRPNLTGTPSSPVRLRLSGSILRLFRPLRSIPLATRELGSSMAPDSMFWIPV